MEDITSMWEKEMIHWIGDRKRERERKRRKVNVENDCYKRERNCNKRERDNEIGR